MSVAIADARIAGLVAARKLFAAGCEPIVFEKSRGLSGRTSVRASTVRMRCRGSMCAMPMALSHRRCGLRRHVVISSARALGRTDSGRPETAFFDKVSLSRLIEGAAGHRNCLSNSGRRVV